MGKPYSSNGVLIGQGAAMEPKTTAAGAADTVFRVPTAGGEPGFGTIASGGLAADSVTYAKMQNVSAASRLLGRGSAAGAGDVQELTVGAGLSISGTVLLSSLERMVTFFSGGDVAAATTTYLAGGQGTEANVRLVSAITGTIVRLDSLAGAFAGAGESFTYTVRVNGSDTAITHVVSGGAALQGASTGSVALTPGQYMTVKLTTTGGAGVGWHNCSIAIA